MKICIGTFALAALAGLASLPPVVLGNNLRVESLAKDINSASGVVVEEDHQVNLVELEQASLDDLVEERDAPLRRALKEVKGYHSPRREGEPCKEKGKSRCHNGLTCVEGTCKAGGGLEEVDLKFQTHDACAANYTCPLDSKCLVNADGEPVCLCPGSGRTKLIGVSCAVLDGFESITLHSSDDTESCDPQEAGCGFGATCFREKTEGDNYKDEVHCMCPGNPQSVPKGLVCTAEFIDEHLIESVDSGEIPVSGDSDEETSAKEEGRGSEENSEERHLAEFTSSKTYYLGKCVNTYNWKDSAGDGCDWYEKYEAYGCPRYGEYGSTPLKANDACCHCLGANGLPSDAFTIFFLSDIEVQYRGNTWMEAENVVKWIVNYGKQGHAYSHYRAAKMTPSLYIHGGDGSDTYWNKWGRLVDANWLFKYVFNKIYESGVPFISILGNHDMIDNYKHPHSEARNFMRQSFEKSKGYGLSYQEFKDSSWYNSIYYAKFKGLQMGTVNNRMENTGTQFNAFKSKFDKSKPALFFSHKPLHKTGREAHQFSDWKNFIAEFRNPTHLSGDIHVSRRYYETGANGRKISDFTAPYLFPNRGEKPGFLSVLVSPSKGVLEVKKVNYDYEKASGCWKDGVRCTGGDCDKCCKGHSEFWESIGHVACGHEPCWSRGSRCGAGSTCTSCCDDGDGYGYYEFWESKAFTACGREPCWTSGSVCGAGTTCTSCCRSASCPWYQFGVCTCG